MRFKLHPGSNSTVNMAVVRGDLRHLVTLSVHPASALWTQPYLLFTHGVPRTRVSGQEAAGVRLLALSGLSWLCLQTLLVPLGTQLLPSLL